MLGRLINLFILITYFDYLIIVVTLIFSHVPFSHTYYIFYVFYRC